MKKKTSKTVMTNTSGLIPHKDEAEKLVDVPGDGIETLSTLELKQIIYPACKTAKVRWALDELVARVHESAGFTKERVYEQNTRTKKLARVLPRGGKG